MTARIIEIVVMEGIAALMFGFAYAIGVKGKLQLIAATTSGPPRPFTTSRAWPVSSPGCVSRSAWPRR